MDIASSCLMLILLWGQTKDVGFQNVSFKYDTSLTAAVMTRHVPAEAIEGPDWEGPAHLSFALLNLRGHPEAPFLPENSRVQGLSGSRFPHNAARDSCHSRETAFIPHW